MHAFRLMAQAYADADEPLATAIEALLEQVEAEGLVRSTLSLYPLCMQIPPPRPQLTPT